MRKLWFYLAILLLPVAVLSQTVAELSQEVEDDRGFLTRLLERSLSGAGRAVVIEGFEGALSSRATFRSITISDDEGVWLTLRDGAMQWSRAALLRGRIDIAELSAKEILLPRLPAGQERTPTAETREFALPELPVAVVIEQIDVARVELGQPIIGQPAVLSVAGKLDLARGEGSADLVVNRLDGATGQFLLDTSFSNATRVLNLDLQLEEEADGLLVNAINLHGKPSISAEITGEGPLDGFSADIRLATDGQPRIRGSVRATAETDASGIAGTSFNLDLGGDIASLLAPEDRAFFGNQTRLRAEGWRAETGRLSVPVLDLTTEALTISGALETSDQSAPLRAELVVMLGQEAGAATVPVDLPFAQGVTVSSGRLQLHYDAAEGQEWTLDGRMGALDQGGMAIEEVIVDGGGTVRLDGDRMSALDGQIELVGRGIAFQDQGRAEAVGSEITASTRIDFAPGDALRLSELTVEGADVGLSGHVLFSDLSGGMTIGAYLNATHDDLSRLSALSNRQLAGQADAEISGYFVLLSREFDLRAHILGTDLALDQPQLDGMLAGEAEITLDASRNAEGIQISELRLDGERLSVNAAGGISSDASDVTAQVRLADLADAGPEFGGQMTVTARLTGPSGARRLALDGDAVDLRLGLSELDGALRGRTDLKAVAAEFEDGYALESFSFVNPQMSASGQGRFATGALEGQAKLSIPDLSALGRGWSGGIDATAQLRQQDGTRFFELTGRGDELTLGQPNVDGALTGVTDLRVVAEERGGVITLRDVFLENQQMNVTAEGVYGPGVTDIQAQADIRSMASFGPGWRGALKVDGTFHETGNGARRLEVTGLGRDLAFGQTQVDGALAGETRLVLRGTERDGVLTIEQGQIDNPRLNAQGSGTVGGGATDLTVALNAADLRFLGAGFRGAVAADGSVAERDGALDILLNGQANGLAVGQPQVDPILAGQTVFNLDASRSSAGLTVRNLRVNNPQVQVSAQGDPATQINLEARLANLAVLMPEFPGPVVIAGTAHQRGANFILDLTGSAPGSTRISSAGTIAQDFSTMNLAITGTADARLANPFLRTRSLEGPVALDLNLAGPPALSSLGGQIRFQNGGMADPGLGIRLDQINVTVGFQGGLLQVDGDANVDAGGRVSISGPVNLTAKTLDVGVVLMDVTARDPNLYETRFSGQVRLSGGLGGGNMVISGVVNVGETEFRIPSSGLGGAVPIPDIIHIDDTRPVRATRAKAGLEPYPGQAATDAGMTAPPSTPPANPPRLDLQINAPNRIFIRGRGVDAEVGGVLQVSGTPRSVIPIGHLELIRGRVDLLGKRFDLNEGLVELQGSMIPVIRLVAETTQDGITTRIIVDGDIRDPELIFESSPEMPQEEVLSQLLFGRGLDTISPLQAAQLANAIAVLAGAGGEGIVGNLRNRFGLDDLDVGTDNDGNVQVRAGRYLSENVYTDVALGDDGQSTINLNLDITETLRARGSVGSDGDSTLGIYFERDY